MNTQSWTDWSCAVQVSTVREVDLARAVRTVREVMAEVEAAVSRFRADSDLSRVNAAAGRFVPVSSSTLALVELALQIADLTGGAVTPTVGGPLADLGYDADIAVVRARANLPGAVGCAPAPVPHHTGAVQVDRELCRVGVTRDTRLDLGAIAKAYAVDEAVARIAPHAAGGVLVSIGGDLAVHDAPSDGWSIAVSETADAAHETVLIDQGALATSSTTGRRWAEGRHHIIDPRTGRCAQGPWRTATVWGPTAVAANTMSTWLLVDAAAAERALADEQRPARLVADDGAVVLRHGWPDHEAVAS